MKVAAQRLSERPSGQFTWLNTICTAPCLKDQLWEKQLPGYRGGVEEDGYALVMDMGTGKTYTSLAVVQQRVIKDNVRRILVVAPLSALVTWVDHIYDLLSPDFIKEELEQVVEDGGIFLVNYELVWRHRKTLAKVQWDMIILDEAHAIRRRTSKQSKACHYLGDRARFRLLLTGTPLEKDYTELWSLMRFVEPLVFGHRWKLFEGRYLKKAGFKGYKRVVRADKKSLLLSKIRPFFYRVELDDLPPATTIIEKIYLEGSQLEAYEEMRDHLIVSVGDKKSTARMVGTQLVRLQQVTGGFLKDDEGVIHSVGDAKIKALRRVLRRERPDKFVVFARFTHEVALISAELSRLGMKHLVFVGKTKDQRNLVHRFKNECDIRAMVCQIRTGGVGVDGMQVANLSIFYSKTFSWIDVAQAKARIRRKGQRRKTKFISLVVMNSIDSRIEESLKQKTGTVEYVFNHMKRRPSWPIPRKSQQRRSQQRRSRQRKPTRAPKAATASATSRRSTASPKPRSA